MHAALPEGCLQHALITGQSSRMEFCYLPTPSTPISFERDNRLLLTNGLFPSIAFRPSSFPGKGRC